MPKHSCFEPITEDFRLKGRDPDDTSGMARAEAEAGYLALQGQLRSLQERFYADGSHALLLVLQGMDTSGKDGTIKKVVDAVDPQGVRIAAFKAPSTEEMAHDFLWRIHQQVPCRGQIGIFNRSHYEDVLIVRVKNFVPKKIWKRRYDQINAFERQLVETGTVIVKVMLHISKAEQKERLEERIADPEKRWKFNAGDLVEREAWDAYQEAYEDLLHQCSTEQAPWYVVPANRKWYRNWVVTKLLVNALEQLNPQYPQPDWSHIVIPD